MFKNTINPTLRDIDLLVTNRYPSNELEIISDSFQSFLTRV